MKNMAEQISTTPEYLTVRELAELLRIKERKVYELASSGEVPVSRVTGKLLFPEREIRAWIDAGRSGGDSVAGRPGIFLGSHDPLLEWAIRKSKCGLASQFDGSLDGLARFADQGGVATGLHLADPETGEWNVPEVRERFASQNVVLVAWATRRRGLVMRPTEAGTIRALDDMRGRNLVPRPEATGTQALFERMLAEEGLALSEMTMSETAPSESDAILAVVQGLGEVAFGLESFARHYGLHFVPLVEERFDLLIDRRAWFEPTLQALFSFCDTENFRSYAADLAGYDANDLGAVRWNA